MLKVPYTVVLLACMWTCQVDAVCFEQDCVCGATYLFCQEPGTVDQIPPLTLNLDTATEISDGILPSNLSQFTLMDSKVTVIQDAALNGSGSSLETISITNCTLTNIPDAFLILKAVKFLTIADTYIHDWNTKAMINVGQAVQFLSLSNVGLNVWPSWLKQCPLLTTLEVENGLISSIPDDAFELMATSLTSLNLNNNSLKAIPKAFSKLTAITTLYLENNMISNVTWLPQINTLSVLGLTGNSIFDADNLSNSLRPYASSLTSLELDYNRLTSFPALNFLTIITELDITNNLISDPVSGSWPPNLYHLSAGNNILPLIPQTIHALHDVISLRLPFNHITEISATDFSATMYNVELQYNLITKLTDASFPKNSSMVSLYLNNNLISSISSFAFSNLVKLLDLNIGGNKLVRLPLALASLISLEILDMSDNSGLVCTCLEKGLQKLIVPMSVYSVKGDCGQISIYEFFTALSSDCPD